MAILPAPIRGEAVVRAAQESIKQYIIDNQLSPGTSLPTEHALARTLGISRNSLREALRALETTGVVETRHGLGTFVGQASLAPLIDGMAFTLAQRIGGDTRALRELLELREILEVELVRRVTGLHSEVQRARLGALVAQMEENAHQRFIDPALDSAFHDALYEPLRNRAVTLLLHAFWEVQERVRSQLPNTAPGHLHDQRRLASRRGASGYLGRSRRRRHRDAGAFHRHRTADGIAGAGWG
ncbi:MAG: GntR family transcriptional regulator [Chloroflexia bacterium]